MQLSDVETMVRQDLFDPLGGPNMRWQTTDIDRAIDKAVDHYSAYYPNILYVDMPAEPFQRTYPYPQSWNPNYPAWWIERVIYPLQIYGSYFTPPGFSAIAAKQAGSGLSVGSYQYAVTFLSQGGETTLGPATSVSTSSGSQQIALSSIAQGPAQPNTPGIATNTVIGRNLYRSLVNGSTLYLLATISDNTTSSYIDSVPDSALINQPQPPTLNTSGVMYYPPIERNFSEYSNIFDSTAALAAGGNQGTMGAVGVNQAVTNPSFTLMLNNADLPKDNTLILRVFYASKHQLDTTGSTIPEVHRDIIVLGACAYAMEAYQVPTNDNFDFQDGGLRDRIDDTNIPASWLAATRARMDRFIERLEEIKQQRDYCASARTRWGDEPRYWPRL
ncbi:hypothetical protein EPA93_09245 [Ktedonosporobacter rubrisoli]|uniref:Uncharacterized protein n=1 Tax=Ktedonosporobacter rubrisoli TaxID=2509675 RepID=A0A4P6JLU6_KTERU|nr:hypothetical protein [Ktedonosporobacter rubrisoli]QBD76184.1 hypothetical protein EPA93_09245 [Ktedonosporobacter rubrisoli]